MERRLAAILVADVVGYSRLMERDEADTFARLKAHRTEVFEPLIDRHHGRIFKLTGDGLLAEFGSAANALECAVALLEALAERNAGLPADRWIELRIGLHVGDVIIEGEDRYGDVVNVAARLQALSEPGGVCASRPVVDHVKQKLPLTFEPMGEERLKNIAEPVSVYRVRIGAAAHPGAVLRLARLWRRRRNLIRPALALLLLAVAIAVLLPYLRPAPPIVSVPRSIAVLPFANISGDSGLDYFSEGVTENTIGALARSPDLQVVAAGAAAAEVGKPVDVKKIGREMNVRYVLEGTVRKGSEKVRITAQLMDARSGEHVWDERYDEEGADPLALQDEVTGKVIASLAGHEGAIQKREYEEAWGKDTASLQEYDYYLRGHSIFFRLTKKDMAEARRIFQEGLRAFPESGLLRVKIGWTYYQDWGMGWSEAPAEDLGRAHDLARDGLSTPNPTPIAQWYGRYLLALTQLYHRRDAVAALLEAATARTLAPHDPIMLAELATIPVWAGTPELAIEWLREAARGGSGLCCNGQITLASAYNDTGRYEAAIEQAQSCYDCSRFLRNWSLMTSYLRLGRLEEARAASEEMRKARPDFSIGQARLELYYKKGADTERALEELRQLGFPEA